MIESPRGIPVKQTIRVKGVGKVMAQTMKSSVDNAALSQVTKEIDVTALQNYRKTLLERSELVTSLNTLMMAATAKTLQQHPLLNAELVERDILIYQPVNLGMAVDTPNGLIVVVVPDADSLSIAELSTAINSLAEQARNGNLSIKDVEGGTFTVSNLGMYGIDGGFPIPRAPEGAILLIGAARAKPAVIEESVTVRQIALFNLTFDHRFIDGATAAAFLRDLNKLIAQPETTLR